MYEKEIQELNKEIERNKQIIENTKSDTKSKYKLIFALITILTLLGVGLGSLISQPLMMPIMGLALSGMISSQIYDKGIRPNQNKIATQENKIKEHKADIKRYQLEETKSYEREITQDNKKTYSFNYNRDKSLPSEEELESMIDFFKNPEEKEDNHRNKK